MRAFVVAIEIAGRLFDGPANQGRIHARRSLRSSNRPQGDRVVNSPPPRDADCLRDRMRMIVARCRTGRTFPTGRSAAQPGAQAILSPLGSLARTGPT